MNNGSRVLLAPSAFTPSGWPRYDAGEKERLGSTRTLTKVFGLNNVPSPAQLNRVAKCLALGQSAELDMQGVVYYLDPSSGLSMSGEPPKATRYQTVVVRAVGDDPVALIDTLRRTLRLQPNPTREVDSSEVLSFVYDTWTGPREYSLAEVHARLDFWGERALPHLRAINLERYPSRWAIAQRMVRYLRETKTQRRHPYMRFNRKPVLSGASVGYRGWPLQGVLPASVSSLIHSKDELLTRWTKEDFMQRVARNLLGGAIRLHHWPEETEKYDESEEILTPQFARSPDAWEYMACISLSDVVRLRTVSGQKIIEDDVRLMSQVSFELLGYSVFGTHRFVEKPSWWRFRLSPFSKRGVKEYGNSLTSTMRFNGMAVRFFTPQRWMRIGDGFVTIMEFGKEDLRTKPITGVVVEGGDKAEVRVDVASVVRMLGDFGKRVKGPKG